MPTPRKKTVGFFAPEAEEATLEEKVLPTDPQDEYETEFPIQIEAVEEVKEPELRSLSEIAPSVASGFRFANSSEPVEKEPQQTLPKLNPPPRRQPRNIPKFSRFK